MKNLKMYEANDKMITLIKDNYNLLQTLGSFGIKLGFGDKTVRETCELNHVDTYTFLAVVNYTMNGYTDYDEDKQIDIRTSWTTSCRLSADNWRRVSMNRTP